MPDADALDERLRAVERTLTETDTTVLGLDDDAALDARVDDAEDRLDALDERVREVESAVQALRGYVGNVRHVNQEVEQRADAALARVEQLERAGRPTPTAYPTTPTPTPVDEDEDEEEVDPGLLDRLAGWL